MFFCADLDLKKGEQDFQIESKVTKTDYEGAIGLLSFPKSRCFSCRRGGMQSPCQGNDDFVAGSGLTPVLSGRKKAPHSGAGLQHSSPPPESAIKSSSPATAAT